MENNFNFSATPQTQVINGRDGWTGKTQIFASGKNWEITTTKRGSGKIATHCHAITVEGPGVVSFMMFGQPESDNFWVNTLPAGTRSTEKTIKEAHAAGLALFLEKHPAGALNEEEEKKIYKIEIGQIIFTDGPGYNENERAIYEIIRPGKYKTVLLDGSDLRHDDHVRNYTNKFGIGVYYNEGEKISEEEVKALVLSANQVIEERATAAKQASEAAAIEKAENIKIGAAVLSEIPAGAVSILLGHFEENDSDYQTDYFGSHTTQTVYLGFSNTDRNNFIEMRKAAARFEGTKHLETAENVENRENYTGGAGYYLGESRYDGWQVRKGTIPTTPAEKQAFLEKLQIAIAKGLYFIPEISQEETQPTPAPVNVPAGEVQIIEYSAKSVAVIGNTKPIKDKLKELGGLFNFRLSCGAGWIFPKTKLEALQAALCN